MSAYSAAILATAGLMAYYRLDEVAGATTVADASGNGRAASRVGGVAFGAPGAIPADAASTAATFDGSTGYLNAGTYLPVKSPVAFEFWYRPTAGRSVGTMFGRWEYPGYEFIANDNADGSLTFYGRRSDGQVLSLQTPTTAITSGAWQHVVLGCDDALFVYVNGSYVAGPGSTAFGWGIEPDSVPLVIGAYQASSPTGFESCAMDEFAIYSRVLTASEVANHYSIGITAAANGLLLRRRRSA